MWEKENTRSHRSIQMALQNTIAFCCYCITGWTFIYLINFNTFSFMQSNGLSLNRNNKKQLKVMKTQGWTLNIEHWISASNIQIVIDYSAAIIASSLFPFIEWIWSWNKVLIDKLHILCSIYCTSNAIVPSMHLFISK